MAYFAPMALGRRDTSTLTLLVGKLALIAMTASGCAWAQTLYAVSVRVFSDPSYHGLEGNLYRVDPASAVATLVAPLRLDGRQSVGLDGLAIHPKTGKFFGVTAAATGPIPHSFVRLDPANGAVSFIGDLGAYGSDLAFDSEGTLFIWLPKTAQLGRVDLDTGKVTPIGAPRPTPSAIGGIEVLSSGRALVAATGGKGTLDSVDLKTGAISRGVQLSGARYPELVAGLAQSPDGVLLGVNTNGGSPALADLVRIDRSTGRITFIGPLPNDTDAIAFGPRVATRADWDLDHWRALIFPVLGVALVGVAILLARGRRGS